MPNIRCALSVPIISANVTEEQPSGGTPSFPNDSLNVAFSSATMPSVSVALVTAAPMAGPLTAARSGFGKFMKCSKSV
eukprot:5363850-Prymnesium_polylepis.1